MSRPEAEGIGNSEMWEKRDALRTQLDANASALGYSQSPRFPFAHSLRTNFDTLPINWGFFWNDPRRVNALIPIVFSATNMAFHSVNNRFLTDEELATPDACRDVVTEIATDTASRDTFASELRLFPVSYIPGRIPPFYFLMKHVSRNDSDKPLAAVDLGAASGYLLRSINGDRTQRIFGNGAERKIQEYYGLHGEVPLICGINVDIYPEDEVIHRSQANMDNDRRREFANLMNNDSSQKYPFIEADLRDRFTSRAKIQAALQGYDRTHADVVVNSFAEYQVMKDHSDTITRNDFNGLALDLLDIGGLLISVGEELFEEDYDNTSFSVNVYQKKDANTFQFLGIPYFISDDGDIIRFSSTYFQHSLSNGQRVIPAFPNVGILNTDPPGTL